MLTDNRALNLAHVFRPTDGSVKFCAKFDALWLVFTHGRASPLAPLLFQAWLFYAHHLIFQEDPQKSVSQILRHLCTFWIETKNIYIWRKNKEEPISQCYSLIEEGGGGTFPLGAGSQGRQIWIQTAWGQCQLCHSQPVEASWASV